MNNILQCLSEDLTIENSIAFWGLIISTVIMLATMAQVAVAYIISRYVNKYQRISEALDTTKHVNAQWQNFNELVITNKEFRSTIIHLEQLNVDEETIKLKYMIFYILNVLHDCYHSQKAIGVPCEHLSADIEDQLGILSLQRDMVLSILDGNRGYDKEFIELCKQKLG